MLKTRRRQQDVFATLPIELIHSIQSLLPVKEAARMSILSKSLLHAWSTIRAPTLKFRPLIQLPNELLESLAKEKEIEVERQRHYNMFMENTLVRYHRDNIPINTFDLRFYINNNESAFVAEDLIVSASYNTGLTFPNEIFSCQNLEKMFLWSPDYIMRLWINPPSHMIKCVSLRVLYLKHISFRDEVFEFLMSTCILLEDITVFCCDEFKTLKVKNLPFLRTLIIRSVSLDDVLETSNLPSLDEFEYSSYLYDRRITKTLPFNMDSLGSVTFFIIRKVNMNIAFFDMIKNKMPFLKSLYLGIDSWVKPGENLFISSRSLKKLTILMYEDNPINLQVVAPNLLSVVCNCSRHATPSLSFPNIAPGQVKVRFIFEEL